MKKAIIFTDCSDFDFPEDKYTHDNILIAVDSGADLLYKKRLIPDLIIGDLDSIDPKVQEFYESRTKFFIYPEEKDQTDTELALHWCIDQEIKEIVIMNSMQGKFDHAFGIIALLLHAERYGIKASIENNEQIIFLAEKKNELNSCSSISLLPLSEKVTGLNTRGLKYSLTNESLYNYMTRGISNEFVSNTAGITFEQGLLLIVQTK